MNDAIFVANNLRTDYQGKGHGGYNIYVDDKIKIMYDTYFPNVSVYVKDGTDERLVYSKSGHGIISVYNPGKWEDYIKSLLPRAHAAKALTDSEYEAKNKRENDANFGPANDSKIFG